MSTTNTISPDTIQVGDHIRIQGDHSWHAVIAVHDQGVEILNRATHHWFRWGRIKEVR